jgi:hypothetical protein
VFSSRTILNKITLQEPAGFHFSNSSALLADDDDSGKYNPSQ